MNKKVHTNSPTSGLPEPAGTPRSFGPEGYVPEESMMHPDIDEGRNDDQDNWSEEEVPAEKREITRRVF